MVAIPVVLSYFIRNTKMSSRRFYVLHFLLLVLAAFFGRDENEGFFNCVIVAIMIGYSSFVKFKSISKSKECPGWYFLFVMLMAYFSGIGYGTIFVSQVSIVTSILFVVGHIIYQNTFRLDLVFFENANTSNFPAKQLKTVNNFVVALTVMGVVLVMMLGLLLGGGDFGFVMTLLKAAIRGIATFVIWLIWLLGKTQKKSDMSEEPSYEPSTEQEVFSQEYIIPEGDLEKWINAAIIVIAVITLIVIFVAIFKKLNRFMSSKLDVLEDGDTIEFIKNSDYVEKYHKGKSNDKVKYASINEKYRRLYKKKVLNTIKKKKLDKPDTSLTPSELTDMYISNEEEKSSLITQYYEKARYSNEVLKDDELKIIR